MILAAVIAAALIVPVSIDRAAPQPPASDQAMPAWRTHTELNPLVMSATDCIARKVSTDPRYATAALNELIVDSMTSCAGPLRAMIDAYDRQYGDGAGEKFFMGPYLDGLPAAVSTRVKNAR